MPSPPAFLPPAAPTGRGTPRRPRSRPRAGERLQRRPRLLHRLRERRAAVAERRSSRRVAAPTSSRYSAQASLGGAPITSSSASAASSASSMPGGYSVDAAATQLRAKLVEVPPPAVSAASSHIARSRRRPARQRDRVTGSPASSSATQARSVLVEGTEVDALADLRSEDPGEPLAGAACRPASRRCVPAPPPAPPPSIDSAPWPSPTRPQARRPVRPARPDLRPLRGAALVRAGPALAAVSRLADRGRAGRPRARRRDRHRRGRARARPAERLRGRRASTRAPEMLADGAARASTAASSSSRRAPSRCRSPTASSTRSPSRICSATSTTRPRRCASSRASCGRAGRSPASSSACPPGVARPLWELYVRAGLPLAGRVIGRGWREVGSLPRPVDPGLLRALAASRGCSSAWRAAGIGDVRARRLSPRRRDRDVGTEGVDRRRPAFYALGPAAGATTSRCSTRRTRVAPLLCRGRRRARAAVPPRPDALDARRVRARDGRRRARAGRAERPAAADADRQRTLVALAVVSLGGALAIGVGAAVAWGSGCSRSSPSARSSCRPTTWSCFGGRFHTDWWFALAWGAFPVLTGLLRRGAVDPARGGARRRRTRRR